MSVSTSPPPSLPRMLMYLSVACSASAAGGFVMAMAGAGVPPLGWLVAPPLLVLGWCAYLWMRPTVAGDPQRVPPDEERDR